MAQGHKPIQALYSKWRGYTSQDDGGCQVIVETGLPGIDWTGKSH